MGWFEKRAQKKLNDKLLKACRGGKVQQIAECLDRGADINTQNSEGFGALTFAITARVPEAVQLLLDRGANINEASHDGRTAAMIACYNLDGPKGILTAKILFTHRPAPDLSRATPDDGWTAMHCAAYWDNDATILDLLIEAGGDINIKTLSGKTPLHIAAQKGKLSTVKKLLSLGADPNLTDIEGQTPANDAQKADKTGIAEYLIAAAAPPPPTPGWTLTAQDEIAHVALKNAVGYTITSIFNFTARTYTQISRNLDTNAESQAFRFFNEIDDQTVLDNAYQELLRQGGKGTPPHIRTALKK